MIDIHAISMFYRYYIDVIEKQSSCLPTIAHSRYYQPARRYIWYHKPTFLIPDQWVMEKIAWRLNPIVPWNVARKPASPRLHYLVRQKALSPIFINQRESPILGITLVRQDVVICLYIGVLSIVATPFNLELWNFGITFLMCRPIILDVFSRIIALFLYFFTSWDARDAGYILILKIII